MSEKYKSTNLMTYTMIFICICIIASPFVIQFIYDLYKESTNNISIFKEKKFKQQIDNQNQAVAIQNLQDYICRRYTKIPKEIAIIISTTTYGLCKEHNISFELIVGLMEVESMFNPLAISSHDSRGLMQVTYRIWAETLKLKSNKSLYNVKEGTEAGILVLKHYLKKKKGNVSEALKSYNGAKNHKFSNKVLAASGRFTIFCYNNLIVNKEVK